MKTQLIITHPGSAHFDEVTAISFYWRRKQARNFASSGGNPAGGIGRSGYLGHRYRLASRTGETQFRPPPVAGLPGVFRAGRRLPGTIGNHVGHAVVAVQGQRRPYRPVESSVIFHAGDDLVNRNPVESWLVTRFAGEPEQCIPMLKDYGKKLIAEARTLKKQIDYWKTAERLMIAGVPAVLGETKESAGLDEFRRLEKNPPDIVISLDRRQRLAPVPL